MRQGQAARLVRQAQPDQASAKKMTCAAFSPGCGKGAKPAKTRPAFGRPPAKGATATKGDRAVPRRERPEPPLVSKSWGTSGPPRGPAVSPNRAQDGMLRGGGCGGHRRKKSSIAVALSGDRSDVPTEPTGRPRRPGGRAIDPPSRRYGGSPAARDVFIAVQSAAFKRRHALQHRPRWAGKPGPEDHRRDIAP